MLRLACVSPAFRLAVGEQRRHAAERGADHRRPHAAPLGQGIGQHPRVGGEIRVLIGAVGDPFGIAVAALIDRVGDAAHARDQIAGFLPGVAGLAAAVQQQHRRPLLAIDVARQRVAGRALEHRGGRRDRTRHACSWRNCSTPALNTLSPTASMWSRPGIGAPGVRHDRSQFLGRACDRILGADRDQRRRPDRGGLLAAQHLPRAADAGGERPAVGLGLVGKGAEHAALRVGDVVERRRLQRLGDALRQPHAVDQVACRARRAPSSAPGPGCASARKAAIRAPIE